MPLQLIEFVEESCQRRKTGKGPGCALAANECSKANGDKKFAVGWLQPENETQIDAARVQVGFHWRCARQDRRAVAIDRGVPAHHADFSARRYGNGVWGHASARARAAFPLDSRQSRRPGAMPRSSQLSWGLWLSSRSTAFLPGRRIQHRP